MSKYIKSVLTNNKFKCKLSFLFEDEKEETDIDILIDTGCQNSHISADLIYIFLSDEERLNTKAKYMKSRNRHIGLGVESQNKNINQNINDVNNERLIITQHLYDCRLGDMKIGNLKMGISYDTSQVALLGMEFLKAFDIHIGKNKKGETVLLACPNNQLNQEYYLAREKEFGISKKLNASIINSITIKEDTTCQANL